MRVVRAFDKELSEIDRFEDANALLQTALREENRAYVQIDPAEK